MQVPQIIQVIRPNFTVESHRFRDPPWKKKARKPHISVLPSMWRLNGMEWDVNHWFLHKMMYPPSNIDMENMHHQCRSFLKWGTTTNFHLLTVYANCRAVGILPPLGEFWYCWLTLIDHFRDAHPKREDIGGHLLMLRKFCFLRCMKSSHFEATHFEATHQCWHFSADFVDILLGFWSCIAVYLHFSWLWSPNLSG